MEIDWFEKLLGFKEESYKKTKKKLAIRGKKLHSLVNFKSYEIGEFELKSLNELREETRLIKKEKDLRKKNQLGIIKGDVKKLLRSRDNHYALFQVASQFNMLEMIDPSITPEDGVTRYRYDYTQGPACSIATGAATIYRNYFVPNNGIFGQTKEKQLNGLEKIEKKLRKELKTQNSNLWKIQNGYILFSEEGISKINNYLELESINISKIKENILIGFHQDVEVINSDNFDKILVSLAFCSAIPVSYNSIEPISLKLFSSLILEAAYEATLLLGVINANKRGSNKIFLTLLGGGAFGNDEEWIISALEKALYNVENLNLDIKIVSYHAPSEKIVNLVKKFSL
jgi:hypothetical protein